MTVSYTAQTVNKNNCGQLVAGQLLIDSLDDLFDTGDEIGGDRPQWACSLPLSEAGNIYCTHSSRSYEGKSKNKSLFLKRLIISTTFSDLM